MQLSVLKSWKELSDVRSDKITSDQLLYVYIFERGRNFIKIGITKNLYSRARNIITSSGVSLRRVGFSGPYFKAKQVERLILDALKDKRVPGSEWVRMSFDNGVKAIEGLPDPEPNPPASDLQKLRRSKMDLKYGSLVSTGFQPQIEEGEPWALVCWDTVPPTYIVSRCPMDLAADFMAGFSEDSSDDSFGRLSVSAHPIEWAELLGAVRVA